MKVEDYIDGRRRKKREEKARELSLKYTQEHQDVSSKFTDAKRKLADVSLEEWETLPDSQDLVKFSRKKRNDFQRYTPVPDSVLASRAGVNDQIKTQIDSNAADTED